MWDRFIDLSAMLTRVFVDQAGESAIYKEWHDGHQNCFWKNDRLDMGHISIVDLREEKSIWMMHVNAYARDTHPMPIYGFDVVCGPKKLTGCFHDLSPTCVEMDVEGFEESKRRELPDWALEIFSPGMIAAGNVTEVDEAERLVELGVVNLQRWFERLNGDHAVDGHSMQRHALAKKKYCENQLKNPHSFRVMESLGFPADYLTDFKTNYQFPY